jgi:hypothetical protein
VWSKLLSNSYNLSNLWFDFFNSKFFKNVENFKISGLLLLTAPQLARAHQHLEPLASFVEITPVEGFYFYFLKFCGKYYTTINYLDMKKYYLKNTVSKKLIPKNTKN